MELQAIDYLVDDLAVGSIRETNQVQIATSDCLNRGAMGRVVVVLNMSSVYTAGFTSRAIARSRARASAALSAPEVKVGWRNQPVVVRSGAICVRLADTAGKRRRNTTREESSHVQLLPYLKVAADHDGNLGVELHGSSKHTTRSVDYSAISEKAVKRKIAR
jgi:hypothetical protein